MFQITGQGGVDTPELLLRRGQRKVRSSDGFDLKQLYTYSTFPIPAAVPKLAKRGDG